MPSRIIRKPDPFDVALYGLLVAVGVAVIYYLQLRSMQGSIDLSRKTMQLDQRPWLYPNVPNFFPLNGQNIPATIHVSNVGKTVATSITGHAVGTVLKKGDTPALDQYGLGHAHTNIYMGAIYPGQGPLDVPLVIVKYGEQAGETPQPVVPTPELARQINANEAFIILFGEIRYCDVFGARHWVKFCNGSGNALSFSGIKECIYYNRADNNNDPEAACKYSIPPN